MSATTQDESVRLDAWHRRLLPYQAELLGLRSVTMWEHKPALVTISLGLHALLYCTDYLLCHSTIFSAALLLAAAFLSLRGVLPAYLRSLNTPSPTDAQAFYDIINLCFLAEGRLLAAREWVAHQRSQIPNFAFLQLVALLLLSALFHRISGFYLSWILSFATLFAPGIIRHQVIPNALTLTSHHWEATLKPQLIALADTLATQATSPGTPPVRSSSPSIQQPIQTPIQHPIQYPPPSQPSAPFYSDPAPQYPYHPEPFSVPQQMNAFDIDPAVWASLTPQEQQILLSSLQRR